MSWLSEERPLFYCHFLGRSLGFLCEVICIASPGDLERSPPSSAWKTMVQGHLRSWYASHRRRCCETGNPLPSWTLFTSHLAILLHVSGSTEDWENLVSAALLQGSLQSSYFVCIYSLLVSVLLTGNLLWNKSLNSKLLPRPVRNI